VQDVSVALQEVSLQLDGPYVHAVFAQPLAEQYRMDWRSAGVPVKTDPTTPADPPTDVSRPSIAARIRKARWRKRGQPT
jgi:hypothetical protein